MIRFFPVPALLAAAANAAAANLLFHAPLDGDPAAAISAGDPAPLVAKDLEWAPGPHPGARALRMDSGGALLAYSAAGNLPRERGTVALWTKREWDLSAAPLPWRTIFATPMPRGVGKERVGSGALWFWWWGDRLRADQSDARDRYRTWNVPPLDAAWHHVAFTWRPGRVEVFMDGVLRSGIPDSASPLRDALDATPVPDRSAIDRFFVGCSDATAPAGSLLSDFRIYDAALSGTEIHALFDATAPADAPAPPDPDWASLAAAAAFRHERARLPGEAPGTIDPSMLALVDEARPADLLGDPDKFSSVGPCRVLEPLPRTADGPGRFAGEAGCTADGPCRTAGGSGGMAPRSLEAGPSKGDRFAVRLRLDPDSPLHLLEIDVPDDSLRTMDLIVQPCKGDADYAMQVGLLLGGEYPNSGRLHVHRCLLWSRSPDVALVAMTARAGAPAAVAAVRAYAVKGVRLPVAVPGGARTPGRHVALYYEDPAVNLEFGLSPRAAASPEGFAEELSRLAATMKFAGQDTLFYPGAWYQGLIGDRYNPRDHAPGYRTGLYEAFDREGLGVVPTVNLNNMPVPDGLVTAASLDDGSLHPTPVAIHDTGRPNPGKWHNTPPNFNVFHPAVQRYVEGVFDALVAEGAPHPSFRGVCLHLTKHCLLWWGDETSGYNDYAVAAFCRDRGLEPPAPVAEALQTAACSRSADSSGPRSGAATAAPLRGAAYAAWLRSDPALHEAWIQWRCDQVTAFYARLAAKLADARPGARLVLNGFVPADVNHPDFLAPDYLARANRACGLDPDALSRSIPNLVLCQTAVPADYRWAEIWRYAGDAGRVAAAREKQLRLDSEPGFWSLLRGADFPWANLHDRYWESAIGRDAGSLSRPWLDECRWRVSTLNPAGANALRHVLAPLRFGDVLGLSKGGFLVGTYGMEDRLAPFALVFRALPPVVLPDLPGGTETVRLRGGGWEGTNYVYAVNAGSAPAALDVPLPPGAADLATGEPVPGSPLRVRLAPGELRAWSASLR